MGKVTVVSELGINHGGVLASAIELANLAKATGADLAKLQVKTPELCTPRHLWEQPRETPWGTVEPYLQYRQKLELSVADYEAFNAHCRSIGLPWTASVWDLPSLEKLMQFDVPWVKIPSAKAVDDDLLHATVATGKPIVLSLGMCTQTEADHAVDIVAQAKGASLLHCHAEYPVRNEAELNLSLIPNMRWRYGMPVGFSSHSVSPFVPLAAVSRYHAVMVEAHLTLDRAAKGSDHSASLEPKGFGLMVREIRRLDVLNGDGRKRLWPSELAARKRLRGN